MNPTVFAYQAVPPTETVAAPGAPAPTPASPELGGGSSMFMLLMFVPLILFMFWQSRSQQKKQEQLLASLKKGDRVLTQSGLIGRLLEVDSRYARLELAPGVKVTVLKSSLSGRDAEEAPKGSAEEKDKESAKDKDK